MLALVGWRGGRGAHWHLQSQRSVCRVAVCCYACMKFSGGSIDWMRSGPQTAESELSPGSCKECRPCVRGAGAVAQHCHSISPLIDWSETHARKTILSTERKFKIQRWNNSEHWLRCLSDLTQQKKKKRYLWKSRSSLGVIFSCTKKTIKIENFGAQKLFVTATTCIFNFSWRVVIRPVTCHDGHYQNHLSFCALCQVPH